MNEFLENLKSEAEANPLMALGIAVGLITATGKLIEAAGSVKSKNAYAKIARNAVKQSKK
jgi:hypothetical protein